MSETGRVAQGSKRVGELTSVKVCWACFCCARSAPPSTLSSTHHESIPRVTYNIALAFKEGLDCLVQLGGIHRHAAAKIWRSRRISRKGGHDARRPGLEDRQRKNEERNWQNGQHVTRGCRWGGFREGGVEWARGEVQGETGGVTRGNLWRGWVGNLHGSRESEKPPGSLSLEWRGGGRWTRGRGEEKRMMEWAEFERNESMMAVKMIV